MVRTQIQLPDALYTELKAAAKKREMSLAELIRRGVEYILDIYPPVTTNDWQLPAPKKLGWCNLSHAEIKAIAQMTPTEERLIEEAQRQRLKTGANH